MKIMGNTVGTPMPRTDWNQTDPKKANYLKGKEALDKRIADAQAAADNAHTAADNAQTAADNAQTAADNAQTAADNAQAAADDAKTAVENALVYVDSKVKRFNVVLTVNDWDGDEAPYKQTIGIEGILGTDCPHYGPVYSEDTETMLAEKEAWMFVDDLDTADGSVTFTCLENKPEANVTVQMEVHR